MRIVRGEMDKGTITLRSVESCDDGETAEERIEGESGSGCSMLRKRQQVIASHIKIVPVDEES